MTEEEIEIAVQKHTRRRQVFMEEGLCENGAWELADKLWERDADPFDDRRVCFECRNYVNKKCTKILDSRGFPTMPARFILQRCPHFDLRGKK
jgi:hypothetical protein